MSTGNNFQLTTLVFENKRLCIYAAAMLILVFFGDAILIFVAHCLHVMFELLASMIEHWLQAAFNLTERQAQIAFFYLFTSIAGCITWWLSKKIYKKTKQACLSAHCRAKQKVESLNWSRITFWFTVFGTSVLLLT